MQWCSKNKKSSNIYTNPPRESAGIKLPLVRRTFSRKTEETTEALITWIKSRTVLESSAENWILLRTWAVWCVTCNLREDYGVKDREKQLNISCDPITDHAWHVCMYSWKKKKKRQTTTTKWFRTRFVHPIFFEIGCCLGWRNSKRISSSSLSPLGAQDEDIGTALETLGWQQFAESIEDIKKEVSVFAKYKKSHLFL